MTDFPETFDALSATGTAYSLSPGDRLFGTLSGGQDRDWFAVQLDATSQTGQDYGFLLTRADGETAPLDLAYRLYDSSGSSVFDIVDNGTVSETGYTSIPNGAAGLYYIEVMASPSAPSNGGDYVFSLISDPAASRLTQEVVTPDQTYSADLFASVDSDWVRLETSADLGYSMTLSPDYGGGDALEAYVFSLFGSNSRLLVGGYDPQQDSHTLFFDGTPTASEVFLEVKGRNGDAGDYTITVETIIDEAGDAATAATARADAPYRGALTSTEDVDWIALELERFAEYRISSLGANSGIAGGARELTLDLLDREGNVLASSENFGAPIPSATIVGTGETQVFARPQLGSSDWAGYFEITVTPTGAYTLDDTANLLVGTEMDNTVAARGGNDTVYGGAGDDTIEGEAGSDLIGGGPGNDEIRGNAGRDTLYGGSGDDAMSGGDGNDLLGGSEGDDIIAGGDGHDAIWGAGGNDNLYGENGNDTLGAAVGDDTLFGYAGADEMWGAAGADSLEGGDGNDTIGAGPGDDWLNGGRGYDALYGGLGDDILFGGDGDDTLYGAAGSDQLDGGMGNDQLFAGPGADGITFSDGQDTVFYFSAAEDMLFVSTRTTITDHADLFANHLSEVAGSAVISDGLGNSVTLAGIGINELTSDNFMF